MGSMRASRYARELGFSLLELMVVMFVLAMMFGLVSIVAFKYDPASELQDYAEDLYEQLRFGSDQAIFGGEHIGLVPQLTTDEDNFEQWQLAWHRWRDGIWSPLETLEPIKTPQFVELAIEIDDEPVDLYQWLDFEQPIPVLTFYGGGEALAGTIILALDRDAAAGVKELERRFVHMEINEIGRVIWRERAEEAERLAGGR